MNEQAQLTYKPSFVSPPGDTLADLLEERGMTQAELAERTGRPLKTINEIIKGKAAITSETAIQLERVLGAEAEFWNQREANYRAYLAREKETETLVSQKNWLKQFPVLEMRRRDWIETGEVNATANIISILNFFGVASPQQWTDGWTKRRLAFRKSSKLDAKIGPTSAWLRKGEIEGHKIDCKPFNKELLLQHIPQIRSLSKEKDPEDFISKLKAFLSECGVAFVIVQPFPGVPVYGASSWLNPEKALIQLSLRGKYDDLFWFAVFHEICHILKHSKKEIFVEIDDKETTKSPEEIEADHFATETLIPEAEFKSWLQETENFSTNQVIDFADKMGIAPGIVVGRLQYLNKVYYSSPLNRLKVRYEWK